MVSIATLEGTINGTLNYHYDVEADVLYLRLRATLQVTTYGEETQDGFILLRGVEDDQTAGLTVIDWWKRFGQGTLPDSIEQIQKQIEPWSSKLAA